MGELLLAVLAASAVALNGCSGVSDLSSQEAYEGVEDRVRDTAAEVFHNRLDLYVASPCLRREPIVIEGLLLARRAAVDQSEPA